MEEIKNKLSIQGFIDLGLAQEIERLFLHPMGFSFAFDVDEETGETVLTGFWDCRDLPEGIVCEYAMDEGLAREVAYMFQKKKRARFITFGFHVQTIEDSHKREKESKDKKEKERKSIKKSLSVIDGGRDGEGTHE